MSNIKYLELMAKRSHAICDAIEHLNWIDEPRQSLGVLTAFAKVYDQNADPIDWPWDFADIEGFEAERKKIEGTPEFLALQAAYSRMHSIMWPNS